MARTNSSNCGSSDWNQTFSYDRFGNITKTGNPGITWNPGYTSGTNRYLGASTYDANGNLKFDTFHNYTWNTDNKPVTIDGTTITYDAFNNPVEKNASGVINEILYTPLGKTATMNGQAVVKFFVPLPGGAGFERIQASNFNLFHHKDGLGSSRFVSRQATRLSYYDVSYAPFGEDYNGSGTSAELNFTGQRQDLVAGTYDFPAREYNPKQGRWISPDPAGLGAVDITNPQSWNRYAYVLNNPLSLTDPSGMCPGDESGDASSDCSDLGTTSGTLADGTSTPTTSTITTCYIGCVDSSPGTDAGSFGSLDSLTPAGSTLGNGDVAAGALAQGIFNGPGMGSFWNATNSFVNQSIAGMAVGGVTGGAIGYGLGEFVGGFIEGYSAEGTTAVGRWMFPSELRAMQQTGLVQEGTNGVTHITVPPNPAAWTPASPGRVFAQFDVPSGCIRCLGPNGWAQIYGPSSIFADYYGIMEMPQATNIIPW